MRPRLGPDLLRACLVLLLLPYAVEKILPLQFAGAETYADRTVRTLNGMELIWVFFGHSRTYQIAVGVLQLLACLLLAMRRTSPVGAALYLAVQTNVALIDLCFRVQTAATLWACGLWVGIVVWIATEAGRYRDALRGLCATEPAPPPLGGRLYPVLVALLAAVVFLSLHQISQVLIR